MIPAEWLPTFGFSKNPYDTMALPPTEEGDALLVGREEEVSFVIRQLTTTNMIPILYGENGVGKSSIANVAAYRLMKKYDDGDTRFFFLRLTSIKSTKLDNLEEFEKSVIQEVLFLLLNHQTFLEDRGIDKKQIESVANLILRLGHTEVGVGVAGIQGTVGYTPNPTAESYLPSIARNWLEKCFGGKYSGGIICTIDNLENSGTPAQIQTAVQSMRDTLFSFPGLSWILCGTPASVEGIRVSSILEGYYREKKISPIDTETVPLVVEKRIQYFRNKSGTAVAPPVDKALFEKIFSIVHNQLRAALTLCQEFAFFLNDNQELISEDRGEIFTAWLDQKSINLPEKAHEISEKSWELFDLLAMYGTDIPDSDYDLLNLKSAAEFKRTAVPLREKKLVNIIQTDSGFVVRLTTDGWLVHYYRCKQKE